MLTYEGSLLASDIFTRYRGEMVERLPEVEVEERKGEMLLVGEVEEGRYNHVIGVGTSDNKLIIWGQPKGEEEWEVVMDKTLVDIPSYLHFFSSTVVLVGFSGGRVEKVVIGDDDSSSTYFIQTQPIISITSLAPLPYFASLDYQSLCVYSLTSSLPLYHSALTLPHVAPYVIPTYTPGFIIPFSYMSINYCILFFIFLV